MMLRGRMISTSAVLAIPAALLLSWAIDGFRQRDLAITLERVVRSQINEQVRERCESDANWFLTGPLEGRPKATDPPITDPDAIRPRAKLTGQAFELFAYDQDFAGSSTAAPRMDNDIRRALSVTDTNSIVRPYASPTGAGSQVAMWTGWKTGPCAVFLGRLQPPPGQRAWRIALFVGLTAVSFIVAMLAMWPLVLRVRRLSREAQQSIRQDFSSIAPDVVRDELGSVSFAYNDAVKAYQLRHTELGDRDEAFRRFAATVDETSGALQAVERALFEIQRDPKAAPEARTRLLTLAAQVRDVGLRVQNLVSASRLRGRGTPVVSEPVDLAAIVRGVVDAHTEVARAASVQIDVERIDAVTAVGDPALLTQVVTNLVDNAVRYNRPGGHVTVTLATLQSGFVLRVTDSGRGVTAGEFKSLSAIRRFRGDEGRDRQPGVPGLGLAVAREVVERLGWKLDLRQPAGGGFEVEVLGHRR